MNTHNYSFKRPFATALVVIGLSVGIINPASASLFGRYEPCNSPFPCMGVPDSEFRYEMADIERPWGLQNEAILNLSTDNVNLAFTIGNTEVTQIGGTAKDSQGNYIVTGGFTGSIEFGSETITSSKDYDFFIAKYDNAGNPIWIRTAAGLAQLVDYLSVDGGIALTVNPSTGDIYVGGTFVKQLDFLDTNGDVQATLTDGRSDNLLNYELFVAKYAADGTFQWAQGGESGSGAAEDNLNTGRNMITSIILDADGYPYVAGRFSGTNLFGETVTVVGEGDFFLASLASDGSSPFWVSIAGTPGDDVITSLSIDGFGYINVLGILGEGLVQFPNSSVTYENATDNYDTFVMSYDINGEWYFASFLGAGESVVGNDVDSDADGNIFVAGQFQGEASFVGSTIVLESDSAIDCAYLVKYDIEGDALWAVRTGGSHYTKANRVVTDVEGNAYVYGLFSEMAVFGMETEMPDTLYSNGVTDMFLMKYDADGNYQWVRRMDGSDTESLDLIASEDNRVRSNPTQMVYSDVNGPEVIISGDFSGTLFDLTAPEGVRLGFVAAIDVTDLVTSAETIASRPQGLTAVSVYPNPVSDMARIGFTIGQQERVSIELTNNLGQRVMDLSGQTYSAGSHTVTLDAAGLNAGLYFCTVTAGSHRETLRMVVVR
jgi:hypothetical protein